MGFLVLYAVFVGKFGPVESKKALLSHFFDFLSYRYISTMTEGLQQVNFTV